jgi:hypothetical protein
VEHAAPTVCHPPRQQPRRTEWQNSCTERARQKRRSAAATPKLYDLINNGTLDARRFGKRTYITAASLEAFVASLPPLVTPTMAKAEHDRWSGRNRPKPQEGEPGAAD